MLATDSKVPDPGSRMCPGLAVGGGRPATRVLRLRTVVADGSV